MHLTLDLMCKRSFTNTSQRALDNLPKNCNNSTQFQHIVNVTFHLIIGDYISHEAHVTYTPLR